MSVVLLDTTVLIDLLRGRAGAVRRLRELRGRQDVPATCAVNVEEVHRGLKGERESAAAADLFEGITIVPLGAPEGERAGAWRREHGARGLTLSQADCLVASAAVAAGGRLATGNPKDFPMLREEVEHWPVGE